MASATSNSSSSTKTMNTTLSLSGCIAVIMGVIFLRVIVGYQPHSGQDNYHGLHAAYGGDFECQRHWMEITWHLPIGIWYWYDLYYWGLDYPPLSAYLSWICGGLSSWLVGPESVALDTSRGYEDPVHKSFMRSSVIVTDLLFYGSIAWHFTKDLTSTSQKHTITTILRFVFVMIQPAILLIDHGHFQYNTTALGLSLWAFYFMTMPYPLFGAQCVIGSILFCSALSFKQMTLYYAPAVFFYLLGRCFGIVTKNNHRGKQSSPPQLTTILARFLTLGITVIVCFVLIWWPFVLSGPSVTSYSQRLLHVVRRVIPLQRGLFEGKVSNIWCALSVKPIRIRSRIPDKLQPVAALSLTLVMIFPACYRLFAAGRQVVSNETNISIDWIRSRRMLLWGAASTGLSFFLASFQVHEKSLLMALAPISFLWSDDACFCEWFSIVTAWTIWPLIQLDRLQTAYVCTVAIFISLVRLQKMLVSMPETCPGFFDQNGIFSWIPSVSYIIMIGLHIAEMVFVTPENLPDLFPVVRSIIGCGFCCLAWLITCWHLAIVKESYSTKTLTKKQKLQ